jgi:peptidoglycan hydrolase-like amidase
MIITDDDQEYCLDGKKVYSLFPIKSFAYTCTKKRNKIILQGRGSDHHFGLCQWGAHELVQQGWHYKKILKFYYPGTTFMKLYHKTSGTEMDSQQAPVESEPAPVHEITA